MNQEIRLVSVMHLKFFRKVCSISFATGRLLQICLKQVKRYAKTLSFPFVFWNSSTYFDVLCMNINFDQIYEVALMHNVHQNT